MTDYAKEEADWYGLSKKFGRRTIWGRRAMLGRCSCGRVSVFPRECDLCAEAPYRQQRSRFFVRVAPRKK